MTRPPASARSVTARARTWLAALLAAVTLPRGGALAAPVTAALEAGWRAEQRGRPDLRGPEAGTRLLGPRLAFAASDGRATVDATLRGRFESPRLPASRQFAPFTRAAHDARVHAGFAWSRDGDVTVTGEHRRSRDRLYAEGPVAAEPGGSGAWSAGAALRSPSVESAVRALGWTQDQVVEPGGGTASLWTAAVLPWRGESGALLLDWRERRYQAGSEPWVRTRAGLVGLRRALALDLSVRAGAGVGEVWDGARARRGAAGVIEVGAPSGAPGPVSGGAEFQAGFPTLAHVELRHRLGDGWLSARAESAMEVAGSPSVDRVLVQRLVFAVQETLGRATVLALEGSDVRSRALTRARPLARAGCASLSLTRRVRPWLQLGGRSSFLREWDVARGAAPPARRLRLDTFLAVIL